MKPYKALLIATVLLAGCADSDNDDDGSTTAGPRVDISSSCGAQYINPFSDDWQPLPAASNISVSPEVQAARDEILGPNATDPDSVKLWWYGVASFVASVRGHLFLFDAWEIVGLHEDYAPIGREDLVAIQPEAIFIGHGHFDRSTGQSRQGRAQYSPAGCKPACR